MQQNARSNYDKGSACKRSVYFIAASFCFLLLLISSGVEAQRKDSLGGSGRNWRVHHLTDTVVLLRMEVGPKAPKTAATAVKQAPAKDTLHAVDSLKVVKKSQQDSDSALGMSAQVAHNAEMLRADTSKLPADATQTAIAEAPQRLSADSVFIPSVDTTLHVEADSSVAAVLKPRFWQLPGSKEHTPKGATIRSLLVPGWGQLYNREYWKVPLAVAAVGIPVYLYIDNSKEYNSARRAYSVVFEEMPVVSGGKGRLDPEKFAKIDPKFQEAYNRYKEVGGNYVTNFLSTVQNYRNTFRQYRDYSIVAALLGWGLQIADATVFGHLHGFDVSDDISLKFKPVYFQYARTAGIGLSISF